MKLTSFLHFILLIAILTGSRLSLRPYENISSGYIPPPKIKHFTFGFSEQLADTFWIRSIQDFDYCEQKIAENTCKNQSWLYQMLDLITDLAPTFRIPHATGPLALTVLISDIDGASKIFDKAVQHFPTDWPILYRAAYHAIYEEHNKEKAAKLLYSAAKFGAPEWVYALAGRLFSEAGQRELGERIYQEVSQDPNLKEVAQRLRDRLDGRKVPLLRDLQRKSELEQKKDR